MRALEVWDMGRMALPCHGTRFGCVGGVPFFVDEEDSLCGQGIMGAKA